MSEQIEGTVTEMAPAAIKQAARRSREIVAQQPPRQMLPANATPMEMIARALDSGAGVEVIERLMSLQERWDATQARKAFDGAIAAAKAEMPIVTKNREVDFSTAKGRTNYKFEDLGGILQLVEPVLSRHGLLVRFSVSSELNQPVSVTCVLAHRDGHREQTTLQAGRDESGNKNAIQAIGSTVTYLQRYTLKAALGLAVSNDDDGRGGAPQGSPPAGGAPAAAGGFPGDEPMQDTGELISQKALSELISIADAVGADKAAFCKAFNVPSFADIPASRYVDARRLLNAKAAKTLLDAAAKKAASNG